MQIKVFYENIDYCSEINMLRICSIYLGGKYGDTLNCNILALHYTQAHIFQNEYYNM